MWAARATLQAESDQEPPGPWLPLCRQGRKWPDLGQGSCPLQLWSHPLLWHFRLLPLLLLKYVLMSSGLWFLLFCSFQFCLPWAETYSETTGMGSSSGWLGKVRPSRLPHPSLCNEGAWMPINSQVSFYFTYGGNECRQFLSPLKAS